MDRRTTTERRAGRAGRRGPWTRLGLLAGLLALATVAVLAAAEDASACTRTSLNGDARRCTLMENLSQCIRDSEDAYWQCRRRNPGFWGAIKCSFANNIDFASCVVETGAFGIVRGVLGGSK